MFGRSSVACDIPLDLARQGATLTHRARGRDAAAHRHLTIALFPAFFVVALVQRALRPGAQRATPRHSILQEAWSGASTASTFAFLG